MAEKRVKIQRGFVLGFLAVGAVTIASGVILAISGQSINADVAYNAPTGFTEARCTSGCRAYYKEDDLPESDIAKFFPSGITKSYIYIPSSCAAVLSEYRNRLVINAVNSTNPSAAELKSGDEVKFTILVQNTLSKQISYKKFIPQLVIMDKSTTLKTLNFFPGVTYLKINPNATWKKTLSYTLPSNVKISDLKVNFVTYWGSGAYCGPLIKEAVSLDASANVSPTATSTSTSTPSGTHLISLKAGYNAVSIPESWGKVEISPNQTPSITVFDYNWLGDQAWRPSNGQKVSYLVPGMGYYIYTTKAVSLYLSSYSAAGTSGAVAMPGWTLLANSLGKDMSIASDKITAYKSGLICRPSGELTCASEAVVESKTIKEMIQSEKAYNTLYVVKRDDTNDPSLVFDIKTINSSNIDSITIPKDKIYWIYTGSNKWYE